MLAAKAAILIRKDALGEDGDAEFGIETRAKLEHRIKNLDEGIVSPLQLIFRQSAFLKCLQHTNSFL